MSRLDHHHADNLVAFSEGAGWRSLDLLDVVGTVATLPAGTVLMNNAGVISKYDGSHTACGVCSTDAGQFATASWPNYVGALAAGRISAPPNGSIKVQVYVRDCELMRSGLVGLDSAAETALAALGILVRDF